MYIKCNVQEKSISEEDHLDHRQAE